MIHQKVTALLHDVAITEMGVIIAENTLQSLNLIVHPIISILVAIAHFVATRIKRLLF